MALTPCIDCGKEISTIAESCPNCGRPTDIQQIMLSEPVRVAEEPIAETASSELVHQSQKKSVQDSEIESDTKCPNCNDLIDTTHKPTKCMKCDFPLQLSYPEIEPLEDPVESISFWKAPSGFLFGSFLFAFGYHVVTDFRVGNLGFTVGSGIGATIVLAPIMLIGYFIARALTKRSGLWQVLYIGILIAFWMLARYGGSGSFF